MNNVENPKNRTRGSNITRKYQKRLKKKKLTVKINSNKHSLNDLTSELFLLILCSKLYTSVKFQRNYIAKP